MGIIKTPATETAEFTMSNEDFPALPGTQNNDSSVSTVGGGGGGVEALSKVNSTSNNSSVMTSAVNSNVNSKRGLQISSDGKVVSLSH